MVSKMGTLSLGRKCYFRGRRIFET